MKTFAKFCTKYVLGKNDDESIYKGNSDDCSNNDGNNNKISNEISSHIDGCKNNNDNCCNDERTDNSDRKNNDNKDNVSKDESTMVYFNIKNTSSKINGTAMMGWRGSNRDER